LEHFPMELHWIFRSDSDRNCSKSGWAVTKRELIYRVLGELF
jgi:hypothetical protein